MKLLSRDFTKGELVLIIFLVVALLALAYYQFIDIPVRTAIQNEDAETLKALLEDTREKRIKMGSIRTVVK